jgi:hypothetical protein
VTAALLFPTAATDGVIRYDRVDRYSEYAAVNLVILVSVISGSFEVFKFIDHSWPQIWRVISDFWVRPLDASDKGIPISS